MRSDISAVGAGAVPASAKQTPRSRSSRVSGSSTKGHVLDGFFSKGVSPIINSSGEVASAIRQTTAKTVHRGAQRSKTLMRSAVTKPSAVKSKSKDIIVKPASKLQAQKVSQPRAFRAKTIAKSSKVRRFSPFTPAGQVKTVAPDSAPTNLAQTTGKATPKSRAVVMPSMVTSASHHQLERLLDHALHRADAHKKAMQGKLPGRSWWQKIFDAPKWLSIGSVVLAIAVLGGFFAWQNIPQVSMRLAASKSNVNASVPDYTPPGFSFTGPIKYTDNSVAMDFRANSDTSRNFTIIQESSNETSTSLAANTLSDDSSVQTSQINGTTVYIYSDKSHATWVNHGVRYTIQDEAKLDTDQILKIADSLQ